MRKKKWRRSFWPTFLIILVLSQQHCLLYPANCDLLKHCCTFVEIHPSLRNPGSFIRKDFSAKTEKIFLGRKLVKAVISSEDNQTMGNFHREAKRRFSRGIKVGKNRPTSIYLESSNRRIGEKDSSEEFAVKAECDQLRRSLDQKNCISSSKAAPITGKSLGSWKHTSTHKIYKHKSANLQKFQILVQKLITGSSRPQQLKREIWPRRLKFSDHQLRDHDSLTESWERNGFAVTPVSVLLRHPGEQPRHVLGEEQRPLFQLLTSFRFGHHCTYRVPPIQDMSQIAAKFSFYFTMISFSGSDAFGPAVGPRLAGGRRCTEAPLGLL